MKKILKYTLFAALALVVAGCANKELDTNPYGEGVRFAAMAPNPVMRGGELRILGSNLDQVSEIRFAGDVSVTDFQVVTTGVTGELHVIVPLEGPLVGPVTLVGKDGTVRKSFTDLTFTEPIGIDAFTPAAVLSNDVITFKGEYLDVVREVIFTGDENAVETTFLSQSRHELKVSVPSSAISGPIILSDVNELEDQSTIPNHVYTATDLVVKDPTVVTAEKATYKSGDVITVSGAHLDMIQNVALPQVSEVEFNLSEDGTGISFNLPPKATDGHIILTSFAGVEFDAGEIETVTVKELVVKSLAEDERFKAGCEVEISGEDLDLVTKVEFTGAEASWYYSDGKIIATQPDAAKDGVVTLTLDSGKTATTDAIEVVKPEIRDLEYFDEYVAGKTVVTIKGEDLDLVTTVTIGDKKNGFIPCEYELVTDELGYADVKVALPKEAYTGVITVCSDAGYTSETVEITVIYDEVLDITFDKPSFALGRPVSFSGSDLMQIESISIKGKKVLSYSVRSESQVVFDLPEDLGPGVYRLELTLMDGTELTWPVPFEVTAPYTETIMWEGVQDLGSWSINWSVTPATFFADNNAKEGDILRIYGQPTADWWQVQFFDGHWSGMDTGLGNGNNVNPKMYDISAGYIAIELDAARAEALTTFTDWGQAFIVQGENFIVTQISLIQFGATETVVWEGSEYSGDDYDRNLTLGGEDDWVNAGLYDGATVKIYFTTTDAEGWQIQLFDGHWSALSELGMDGDNHNQFNASNSPSAASAGYIEFTAEGDVFTKLTTHANWGNAIILQGKLVTFTKITYE